MIPKPKPVKLGPYTNLSLIARPYILQRLQFVTCAIVKNPNIEPELLEESTVLIVERGLLERTTNKREA